MNNTKKDTAAFIDLDGTLCDQYLWQVLFAHHRKKTFKRRTLYAFIAFHTPIWLLYKFHILSQDFFYHLHGTNLAWLLGGVSIERAQEIWEWVIKNQIIPHLRPEMVAAIEDHHSQAHRVILISGSFTPLLDQLAFSLGVEGAIATPLEVNNGHYTGNIVPPLNIGRGKVERLKHFLEGAGKEIDLAESFFYTDANIDAPVLEMFGHPVAVYPDAELARLAAARGWPVIGGTMPSMKILVAYFSETGNTAKVAQAIYDEVLTHGYEVHLREIRKIAPDTLNTYDLVFLGSPCHDADLAKPAKQILERIPISSTFKLGGFVTHASYTPDGGERERETYQEWASQCMLSFLQASQEKGIEFLGYFSCQGAPSLPIEQFIHNTIVTSEGEWEAYIEEVRKHPSNDDLQKARRFALEILAKYGRERRI